MTTGFLGSRGNSAEALVVQADGKILAGGGPDLVRYTASGALDTGFGTSGIVKPPISVAALAVQADGKILIGGGALSPGTRFAFTVARLDIDGTLDAGFGTAGVVTTDFVGDTDALADLAIQSDGKVVAAGQSDASGSDDFALLRIDSSGALDTGFGTAGILTTDVSGTGGADRAFDVAIQSDGKIVVAGCGPCTRNFAVARYNPDGSLDATATFGSGGITTEDFGSLFAQANAVAIQPNGAILVAGRARTGSRPVRDRPGRLAPSWP